MKATYFDFPRVIQRGAFVCLFACLLAMNSLVATPVQDRVMLGLSAEPVRSDVWFEQIQNAFRSWRVVFIEQSQQFIVCFLAGGTLGLFRFCLENLLEDSYMGIIIIVSVFVCLCVQPGQDCRNLVSVCMDVQEVANLFLRDSHESPQ